jgi:Raf kinase inhibitor-like YbhB/YbcL family protein
MAASPTSNGMTVTSTGIVNGVIDLKYGKHGSHFLKGMPDYSLPLEIHAAPSGTQSFAIFLEDKDAIPVARFSWIHWVVANLTEPKLEENASAAPKGRFVQGVNSWASRLLGDEKLSDAEASRYGGMCPPDKPHTYEIHVYALDTKLQLKDGFFANALFKEMEGHVLAKYTLEGSYPALL